MTAPGRKSIGRQAAIRLVISLGLLVALIAVSSVGIYRVALHKAAHERAEELVSFYTARLDQVERGWEIRSRDFKVRIEASRALEDQAMAVSNLQAFMTIQGAERPFQYLLIESGKGTKLFDFGKDISLPAIPVSADDKFAHYVDRKNNQVYRVFQLPIWLGEARGMGRFAVFFRIDNALLNQMSTPGLTLSALHDGNAVASSGGQTAIERLNHERAKLDDGKETRELPWGGAASDPLRLLIEAPLTPLFSNAEISLGMSVIPIVDGLVLWLTLGLWLMRQTRRLTSLGAAVSEYAAAGQITASMSASLAGARLGQADEIAEVADAMETFVATIDRREREREASAEGLRASELRFRQLFNSGSDAIFVAEMLPDGRPGQFIEVNDIACRRLGYSREELLRLSPNDVDAPEHGNAADPEFLRTLHETAQATVERVHVAKDGRHIPVEVNIHLFNLAGKDAILGVARDISERKQAAMEYRSLIQTTHDGFWTVSAAEGRFLEVNPAYCEMIGYSAQELLGMRISDIEANESAADTACHIAAVMAGREERFESRHRCKDGRVLDVEVSCKYLEIHGGVLVVFVRDITQRKLAERTLLEQQARLNEAQHIAHMGSWEQDLASGELIWSEEMFRILEIDPAQVSASYEAVLARIHPDDRDKVDAAFRESLEGHRSYEITHRLLMADGRIKYVQQHGHTLYGEQGVARRSIGTMQDTSARVLAEMALQQSEERLAVATRAGIIGIWDWDIVNNHMVWDEAMYRLYGVKGDNFDGAYQTWSNAVHPQDRARTEADVAAALCGEREYAPEFRVVWPDGSIHHIKAASHTQFDERGKPLRMIGINYDLTEQKQAEQKIAELLEFNSKVISESTLGILVYKADGSCALANQAAADIWGASLEQILAQNFREKTSWRESGLFDAALRTLESGENQQLETYLLTSLGREVWLSCDLVPLTRGGEPHLLLILNDVSGFRHAEQGLQEAKREAENANRAKSEFLANMSHEIRTPMNAIIGLSDLGLGIDGLMPKLRDYLGKINTSSRALLSILNDILDYSKVEAGRLELESVDFRLEEVLENVAGLFNVRAEEKGLELVFEIAPGVPDVLTGDPLRLGQILNNLVGNAVKFADAGEIHVKVEDAAMERGFAQLRFTVRDSGIGMSAEQVSRLFQAFSQADGSITRRFGGTGLGLTIAKRLVEKMGGDISVVSALGEGSTFFFTLRFPFVEQARHPYSATALKGMRVLVVDDVEISRQVLRQVLEAWGFQVTEAVSGQAALAELARLDPGEAPYELLLLDWKMPGMDGVTVARRLQDLVRQQKIPKLPVVIMVTAFSREQLLLEARGVPLDDVLTKPVTASGLFNAITRLQGGKQFAAGEQEAPDLTRLAEPIRGARILLVEDNEINQTVAQDLLERFGLRVVTANHGLEALELLRQETFDAVLMDLQMPQMDGFEATRRIRLEARWRDLPVIAMTAAVMDHDREACYAAGMNDHVAKPIQPEDLLQALLKWIRGHWQAGQPPCGLVVTVSRDDGFPDALPGFDLDKALALLGGKHALFRKLLNKFDEQLASAEADLDTLVAAGDFPAAAALLHSIKGTAGTLGALDLNRAAAALEAEIGSARWPQGRERLARALAQVQTSIAQLKQSSVTPEVVAARDCASCDWQRATQLIHEVRGLVENSDFVPHEIMVELKGVATCLDLQAKIETLGRHVENIDYESAKTLLDGMISPPVPQLGESGAPTCQQ